MTAQDLKQIHAIKQEIKMWEEKLVELETKALAHGQVLTGMPGGNKTSDNVAYIASDIVEVKKIIEGKLTELKRIEREIMDFINNIEDSYVRQIIFLRCVNCYTWGQVANKLNATPDGIRKTYFRYLDKELEKVKG